MQHQGDQGPKQMGLFEQPPPVAVERLRTEEGDVLAPVLAEGFFRFLCEAWQGAPFLSLYRVSLTAPAGPADELHEAAAGFAADVASTCQLGGALLVEDAARRGEGMGDRHYYGAVVTADAGPVVREMWTERTGAAAAGQLVSMVDGSDRPWEAKNRALRRNLMGVMGYGLRSSKTPLRHRHVVASGPIRQVWGQAIVHVTINVQIDAQGSAQNNARNDARGGVLPAGARARRIADRPARTCEACGGSIPTEMNYRTRYCKKACRNWASYHRTAKKGRAEGGPGPP